MLLSGQDWVYGDQCLGMLCCERGVGGGGVNAPAQYSRNGSLQGLL